ncbi:hypothetical protein Acr_03g0007500 [Actinidia rufa]|uniref:HXXXD-type acyl-transferase family protein n=1 Tax=Actinidia rufa TaxID=165716 RepID=A0A7J0ECR2_9ERIC|nr:hypothetical protein Acr_03g0007500 [Actinidia rufa]
MGWAEHWVGLGLAGLPWAIAQVSLCSGSAYAHEYKLLSDINDQEGLLRVQIPVIQFYRNDPSMRGRDPVKVIREAIAKTLVFYYPFSGRLREGPTRKLMVECTSEGVVFIEADADVTLEQFRDSLHPPFQCLEELLYDVPSSAGVLNCPLLLIQEELLSDMGPMVLARRMDKGSNRCTQRQRRRDGVTTTHKVTYFVANPDGGVQGTSVRRCRALRFEGAFTSMGSGVALDEGKVSRMLSCRSYGGAQMKSAEANPGPGDVGVLAVMERDRERVLMWIRYWWWLAAKADGLERIQRGEGVGSSEVAKRGGEPTSPHEASGIRPSPPRPSGEFRALPSSLPSLSISRLLVPVTFWRKGENTGGDLDRRRVVRGGENGGHRHQEFDGSVVSDGYGNGGGGFGDSSKPWLRFGAEVTRLKCGGFIVALRLNHTMSDAPGLVQFMVAVGEMARGATSPSVHPVWQRELLSARDPPRVTCTHHEYDEVPDTKGTIVALDDMVRHSFFFGPSQVSTLRKFVPHHLQKCSTFEVLTACLWRCRTIALQPDPEEEVRILCIVNARGKFRPPLPSAYYGNAFAFPVALTTAGKLTQNPLGYALELRETPFHGGEELVYDVTRAGFRDVDFGWGKAAYGGPAKGGVVASFYIPFTNKEGESGIVVPICLPAPAMDRFMTQLDNMLKSSDQPIHGRTSTFITSSL